MAEKDKKGFFDKVTDAFSSKDENEEVAELKKELEEAKKEAEASKKAIKDLLEQNRDNSEAKTKAEKAEKKINQLEKEAEEQGWDIVTSIRKFPEPFFPFFEYMVALRGVDFETWANDLSDDVGNYGQSLIWEMLDPNALGWWV